MNALEATLRRVVADLAGCGREWAVIGGLAVSARAEPRTTRDIDVAIAVAADADAEKLILALQQTGYRAVSVLEHDVTGRLATVRLQPPGESRSGVIVDLLFASSGIESEVVQSAEELEIIPGLRVRVASIGHLLALKVLARDDRRRPQDFDDIQALLREADDETRATTQAALRLISARRCDRGKALSDDFDRILAEFDSK